MNSANRVDKSKEKLDMCLVLRESGLEFYKVTNRGKIDRVDHAVSRKVITGTHLLWRPRKEHY